MAPRFRTEAHGTTHANAIDYIAAHGLNGYLRDEIEPSTAALTADGFAPVAFAYPYGAHDATIEGPGSPVYGLKVTQASPTISVSRSGR